MKRRSFLQILSSAIPFAAGPLLIAAEATVKIRNAIGFKVASGQDRFKESITLFEGDTFYCKVSSKDSNGDMYSFESTRTKKGGPPLHYHYEQDEWWYILEGEFQFKIGDETVTAKAGDSVFGPRKVPHAFAKTNEGVARMLIIFQPAGKMEAHFKAVSQGAYLKLSEEEKHRFRQANGFEVVGPALTHEK
jgi:mannose-6-phosphate isomerase-like protein (cupin superfamily)